MVLGVQIAGILFGLFMLYYTFLQYKRKEFTTKEHYTWSFLWILFIATTLFHKILIDPLIKPIGFVRTMDFFIVIGFLFIISIMFYTYTLVRKNQKKVEKIVRDIATK